MQHFNLGIFFISYRISTSKYKGLKSILCCKVKNLSFPYCLKNCECIFLIVKNMKYFDDSKTGKSNLK